MSNSVNFYEFIGFITFNIEVHELVYVYSFLVDGNPNPNPNPTVNLKT